MKVSAKEAGNIIKDVITRYEKKLLAGLDRTGFTIIKQMKSDLPKIYDRPVPFTIGGVRYKKASLVGKNSVKAKVYINDSVSRGTSQAEYLKGTIQQRPGVKPSAIKIADRIGRNRRLVPMNINRNKYGNVTVGNYNKIVDAVKEKSALGKSGNTTYFFKKIKTVGSGLGIIYKRTQLKTRSKILPVFLVLNQVPKPRKTFDMHGYVFKKIKELKGDKFINLVNIRK